MALQAGIVLAALLFMRRMATLSQAGYVTQMLSEDENTDDPLAIAKRSVPAGVEVFEVQGALFFGAASKFRESINQVEAPPQRADHPAAQRGRNRRQRAARTRAAAR